MELLVLVLPIQTVPSATPAVLPVGKGVMHAVVIGRRVQTTEHSWRPWLLNWYGGYIYMYIYRTSLAWTMRPGLFKLLFGTTPPPRQTRQDNSVTSTNRVRSPGGGARARGGVRFPANANDSVRTIYVTPCAHQRVLISASITMPCLQPDSAMVRVSY